MKNLKNLFLAVLAVSMTALTGCLHIIEEATFKNNGSGSYKMTLDMSEMKGMMDMFKGMAGDSSLTSGMGIEGDSTSIQTEGDYTPPADAPAMEDPMGGLGTQMSSVAATIRGVEGITNVVEINDTTNFQFGYSFDFVNVDALNRALRIINKDKYDAKVEEVFRFKGKSFERLGTGDIGEEMKKAMMNSDEEGGEEGSMDMVKMFLADMSYKQIYHFPDRTVKKSDNKLGEITDEGHTLTINIKPFDEEQQKKKASVATKVKLK
ncbi:MAG: hypothetical protein J0M29_09165 [Chitinophagales bacterium]|nr:hypothetical protein [Chitinophagales bacterium]